MVLFDKDIYLNYLLRLILYFKNCNILYFLEIQSLNNLYTDLVCNVFKKTMTGRSDVDNNDIVGYTKFRRT